MYGYTLETLKKDMGTDIYKASKRPDIEDLMRVCLNEKRPVIYESAVTTKENNEKWSQTNTYTNYK
jgi:hypothetical protein